MENFQTTRLENYLQQTLVKDGTVEVHNLQDITSGGKVKSYLLIYALSDLILLPSKVVLPVFSLVNRPTGRLPMNFAACKL
jgi:hypothetical protein